MHIHKMTRLLPRLCAGALLAAAVGAAWGADDVVRFGVQRFDVAGNTLLPGAEMQAAVAPFAGPARDFGDVQRALEALEALYHARGYSTVTVQLPEQELSGGVVRLNVIQTRVRRVEVAGNRYFSDQNLRASLPALVPGQTPNLKEVSANLRLVNENPAKKVQLNLASVDGGADDEVDARIAVSDERPWKVVLNVDNTGTDATGKTHVGALLQGANLWGRDHVGTLQYTTTTEHPDRVAVWAAGYHMPLYALGDSLDLFASYSNVDSGTVNAGLYNLAVSGKGAVYGVRYNQILPVRGDFGSRLVYGLDVRAYKNNVVFGGQDFGNNVTVRPLSVGWVGALGPGLVGSGTLLDFSVALAHNLPGGTRGGSAAFAAVRAGATAGYTLLRFSASLAHALPGDWQARMLVNGQLTGDALVPGEQFGAGGSTTVRGFGERDLASDSGVVGNLELYTPNFCTRALWQCRVLGFVDAAHGSRNHALPGELREATIASTGIGLRFNAAANASLQLDYGHALHVGDIGATSKNKLHLRLALAY
jgi:hemolysin activation/secretion protein